MKEKRGIVRAMLTIGILGVVGLGAFKVGLDVDASMAIPEDVREAPEVALAKGRDFAIQLPVHMAYSPSRSQKTPMGDYQVFVSRKASPVKGAPASSVTIIQFELLDSEKEERVRTCKKALVSSGGKDRKVIVDGLPEGAVCRFEFKLAEDPFIVVSATLFEGKGAKERVAVACQYHLADAAFAQQCRRMLKTLQIGT